MAAPPGRILRGRSVGALVGAKDAAEVRRTGVLTLLQALLALGHDVLLSEPDVARALC